MKKILCLILCLVFTCTMLVSCSDDDIGQGPVYPQDVNKEEVLTINMYIITGDSTTEDAKRSVSTRIMGHTKTTHNTELVVHYVAEADYEATIATAMTGTDPNLPVPNIILLNSEALAMKLIYPELGRAPTLEEREAEKKAAEAEKRLEKVFEANSKLVDLSEYYLSRDYGRLNAQITTSLLQASKVNGSFYSVPNNRILGEYEYLVINKEVAHLTLGVGRGEVENYKSLEDASALIQKMEAAGYDSSLYVKIERGSYELRETLSVDNFCVEISAPTVSSEDAFKSAFAIVKSADPKYNDRAMRMIYNINNDVELRNFLQYGVFGANYDIHNGDIIRIKDGKNNYDMKLIYTGDVFKADNCTELGWTDAKKGYGKLQNDDSRVR